jgi:hypothetical protein
VHLGAFAKLRRATVRLVMSVCLNGTTRLPLDGFSLNVIKGKVTLEQATKVQREVRGISLLFL